MVDVEPLLRARRFLQAFDVETRRFLFQAAVGERKELVAIRNGSRLGVNRIREIVGWPSHPSSDWSKGFLAGIFDAEGCYSRGILRVCNTDSAIINRITEALTRFGFEFIVEIRAAGEAGSLSCASGRAFASTCGSSRRWIPPSRASATSKGRR